MTRKKTNRRFTDEFNQEAVRLALESGKSRAVITRELDSANSWIAKHTEASSLLNAQFVPG